MVLEHLDLLLASVLGVVIPDIGKPELGDLEPDALTFGNQYSAVPLTYIELYG